MNAHNRPPAAPDALDQAIEALLASPISPGPAEALTGSTLQSVEERLVQLKPGGVARHRRPRAVQYVGYGALATAAVLLVGVVLSGIGGSTAAALDKAIERVRRSESVRFRVHDNVKPQAASPEGENAVPDWLWKTITIAHSRPASEVTISGKKFRIDDIFGPGSTWVIDWERQEALITDSTRSAFQMIDMHRLAVSPLDIESMNVCDELLALRKQTARFNGAGLVDGLKADKYVVSGGKAFHTHGDWVIWIGQESGLPVKVTVDFDVRGVIVSRVYDTFDWNPKLDGAVFSLDPPHGFHQQVILHPLTVVPRTSE